ncbi:MAG TPA: Lpg1974 family pore-forming outer membrane protein, partial [Pirellulales bacterium]
PTDSPSEFEATGLAASAQPASTPAIAPATGANSVAVPMYSPTAPSEAFTQPATDDGTGPTTSFFAPPPPAFNPGAVAPLPPSMPVPYYSSLFDQASAPPPLFLLEQPGLKRGWLFSAGTGLVKPYIHSTLSSSGLTFANPNPHLPTPLFAGTVQLPVAQPAWAAMPSFELGYRFEGGLGEVRAAFQFLGSQGTGSIAGFDPGGAALLTSRLNLDVLDLQYSNTEALPVRLPWINPAFMIPGRLGLNIHQENQPTFPPILLTYFVGARVATLFNDSTAVGTVLAERTMSNFTGAGPEVGLQLQNPTRWKPVSIHSKLLAAGMLGKSEQTFSAASALPAIGSGVASTRASDGAISLDIEFGLSYVPNWRQCLCRFTGGYKLQQWWNLGQTPLGGTVNELTLQGLFFRGEVGF